MTPRKLLISVAAAGLIGGAGGAALDHELGATATAAAPAATAAIPATASDTAPQTAGDIYKGAKDAVAYITARVTQQTNSPFGPQTSSGTSTGTGFAITPDGLIVTNAHVIEGASGIRVKVGDGKTTAATVVGTDTSTDIALLKVDTGGKKLATLALGDSSTAAVGDPVYAIGNPYGLDRTLTTGVVSALQRSIQAPDGFTISNVLQTDAALNPGNSGGPLLDAAGRVIGVNSQIESSGSSATGQAQNSGVGFAVPSNTVKRVVAQLRASGKATHAYLGVSTRGAASGAGATVAALADGGPAAKAGLRRGDLITRAGSAAVTDSAGLSAAVDARAPGDHVALTVRRGGATRSMLVTLGTRPSAAS